MPLLEAAVATLWGNNDKKLVIVALGPVPVKVKFNSIQVAVVSWSGENIKHFIPVSSKSIEKEAKF